MRGRSVDSMVFGVVGCFLFLTFAFVYMFPFCCLFVGAVSSGNLMTGNLMGFIPEKVRLEGCLTLGSIRSLNSSFVIAMNHAIVKAVIDAVTSNFIKCLIAGRRV